MKKIWIFILFMLVLGGFILPNDCVARPTFFPPPPPPVFVPPAPPAPVPPPQETYIPEEAAPPPITVVEPELVVLPGTYVYFCPGIMDSDVFFYDGFWYRSYLGHWYRSVAYNGAWATIAPPPFFLKLPPDYRGRTHDFPHIRYHDFHNNWGRWQRERYWDRHPQWQSHKNWYNDHQRHSPSVNAPPRHDVQKQTPQQPQQRVPQQKQTPQKHGEKDKQNK